MTLTEALKGLSDIGGISGTSAEICFALMLPFLRCVFLGDPTTVLVIAEPISTAQFYLSVIFNHLDSSFL